MSDHITRAPFEVSKNHGIIRHSSRMLIGDHLEQVIRNYPEVAQELVILLNREYESAVEYTKQTMMGLVSRV